MISVIIPVKNDRNIATCIEHLSSIKYKSHKLEIVVVDASDNGALNDIKKKYKNINWLHYSNPNKSYTVSEQRTLGVKSSKGEWIIFLDADCVPEKDWLPKLFEPAVYDGELYVTGKVVSTTPTIHDIHWDNLEESRYRHSSGTCNSLIHKSVFDKIGYFDSDYEAGEDVDFSWRAIDAGYKIRYTPQAIVYDDWGTWKQDIKRGVRYGEAKALLYAKHPHKLRNPMVEFTTFTYMIYILLLPLTLIWPWYPLLIVLPIIKNWNRKPLHVVAFSLPLAWGVIRGILKLPFILSKKDISYDDSPNKLLILTQRLGSNYGGIAQAYALQTVLRRKGFDAYTNNKPYTERNTSYFMAYFSRFAPWNILQKKNIHVNPRIYSILTRNTIIFIKNNIRTVDVFKHGKADKKLVQSFRHFVVGSDQVWRKLYANIPQNLFDFVEDSNATKISYAASFGHDNINEYSDSLIKKSTHLAQKFDAISVREKSGVSICKNNWGVKAEHVLDPTLLLDRSDYMEIIPSKFIQKGRSQIFSYILDVPKTKKSIIEKVASGFKCNVYTILPPTPPSKRAILNNPKKYALPPFEAWLAAFENSKFIITDSFHGTVFSIIFNKPFIAIGNDSRGLSRFKSLLETFGLEDRLVSSFDQISVELMKKPINWKKVNKSIKDAQKDSDSFLTNNLPVDNIHE